MEKDNFQEDHPNNINAYTLKKLKAEKHYAFSLDKKKGNSLEGKGQFQMKSLNKGFYDELISYDDQLKKTKDSLEKEKSQGIKESVYSNKRIPESWTNKISYYNDLFKTMSKDRNFVTYLGKSTSNFDSNSLKVSQSTKNADFLTKNSRYSLNVNPDYEINNLNNNFSSRNSLVINDDDEKKEDWQEMIKKKNTKMTSFKPKMEYKQILNILEDYRNHFPIILPKEESIEEYLDTPRSRKVNANEEGTKHLSNSMSTGSLNVNNLKMMKIKEDKNIMPKIDVNKNIKKDKDKEKTKDKDKDKEKDKEKNKIKKEENKEGQVQELKENKENKEDDNQSQKNESSKNSTSSNFEYFQSKKKVFKTTIFTKLLPDTSNPWYVQNKLNEEASANKKINEKNVSTSLNSDFIGSPFISNSREFYQRDVIENPIIDRKLKDINYYGPLYSHCYPCWKRNANFYNKLETNQCLKLLNYLRKVKNSIY